MLACPFCQTDIGARVSAGIFNAAFLDNAVLTLFPLLVLAAFVLVFHFWPTTAKRAS